MIDAEKFFDPDDFVPRFLDESVAVDDVELAQREELEPDLHVLVVQAPVQSVVPKNVDNFFVVLACH